MLYVHYFARGPVTMEGPYDVRCFGDAWNNRSKESLNDEGLCYWLFSPMLISLLRVCYERPLCSDMAPEDL